MNLNHWLKKTPRPVTVLADDKRIPVPNNARAIRDLIETIKSLDPDKLVCLDKDDQVLRSTTLNSESEVEDVVANAATQEQSDLQLFAKLLAEGYERGAKTNEPLLNQAMEFCDRQGQRLAKAEAEIDKLRQTIHKLTLQIGELSLMPEAEAPKQEGSIVDSLIAGAMQAQGLAAITPINKQGAKGAVP